MRSECYQGLKRKVLLKHLLSMLRLHVLHGTVYEPTFKK